MLVTNMYLYAEISVAIRSREQMHMVLVFFQKKLIMYICSLRGAQHVRESG